MPDLTDVDSVGLLGLAYGNDDLVGLAAIRELRADLLLREQDLVLSARVRRRTWAEIGEALGTSRQGAYNRFGDSESTTPPERSTGIKSDRPPANR